MMVEDRAGRGSQALQDAVYAMMGRAAQTPGSAAGLLAVREHDAAALSRHRPHQGADARHQHARVFAALQIYLGSSYVNDFNLFGRTYRVVAQADSDARADTEDVLKIRVRNSSGETVPLGAFTTVRTITAPYRVPRYNLYPAAELDGAAAPGYSQGQAIKIMEKLAAETLPQGFSYEWTTLAFQQIARRQHRDLRLRAGGGVRVPGARRAIRKPDAAARGHHDRADVPDRLDRRRGDARAGQQHPDPGRLHRADRPGRQERHSDRRIRQAARRRRPRPLRMPRSKRRICGCGRS